MAYFAQLDENNVVINVVSIDNNEIGLIDGTESEEKGIRACKYMFGEDTRWIQTSFNNRIRTRFAGVGYIYDEERDAFIAPKPFESWVFDEETLSYVAPVDYPADGRGYYWDEANTQYVAYTNQPPTLAILP